ncbi:MAG: ABC transporter ATP-binding protein [Chloroflexi bacterium]|nr:ABC transporter ATP-binding protein [Chloroflexota bacterium]
MAEPAALEVVSLSSGYGPSIVLRDVNLCVRSGEIVALLGANGAGKSTLLATIAGLLAPTTGSIKAWNREIAGKSPQEINRAGLVLVPEGRQLFASMSVRENLLLGSIGASEAQQRTRLTRVFELFPILKTRLQQRADSLSGGEQQMLAIGRGLMADPKVLLLDEPSLGLAPIVIAQVFGVLEELRAQGVTALLVEQNANLALQHADRAYVLERGQITLDGRGDVLAVDPRIQLAYLGGNQR